MKRGVPDKPSVLVEIARGLSKESDFHIVLGPGAGDRRVHEYMRRLREAAKEMFGDDFSEKKICGENSLAVDFYFPKEKAIVEVALGLPNPSTEFEKDVLKAIIAQETGQPVERLILISRPGGEKKCSQPGRRAVMAWAKAKHSLSIEVYDLHGEPRKRKRPRRTK